MGVVERVEPSGFSFVDGHVPVDEAETCIMLSRQSLQVGSKRGVGHEWGDWVGLHAVVTTWLRVGWVKFRSYEMRPVERVATPQGDVVLRATLSLGRGVPMGTDKAELGEHSLRRRL